MSARLGYVPNVVAIPSNVMAHPRNHSRPLMTPRGWPLRACNFSKLNPTSLKNNFSVLFFNACLKRISYNERRGHHPITDPRTRPGSLDLPQSPALSLSTRPGIPLNQESDSRTLSLATRRRRCGSTESRGGEAKTPVDKFTLNLPL